jgi:WD40-like Beta Propeller Repeat
MRGGLISAGVLACSLSAAGCGVRLDGGGGGQLSPDGSTPSTDGGTIDAPGSPDAPPALGPWGTPRVVTGASNATVVEDDATLSSSTLEMIFSLTDAASNTKDLYYMSRQSPTGTWSAPSRLAFNVTGISDETPRFSPDNLTLFFASGRAGGPGMLDIYKVTRPAVGSTAWGTPSLIQGVNTANVDKWYVPCAANNTYMVSVNNDIGQGAVGTQPTVCAELSSTAAETGPFLSPDCKTIYFASARSGTNKMYRATRPTLSSPFSAPELVTDFDTLGGAQEDPWLSTDLRTFVFVSDTLGSKDVYISTR